MSPPTAAPVPTPPLTRARLRELLGNAYRGDHCYRTEAGEWLKCGDGTHSYQPDPDDNDLWTYTVPGKGKVLISHKTESFEAYGPTGELLAKGLECEEIACDVIWRLAHPGREPEVQWERSRVDALRKGDVVLDLRSKHTVLSLSPYQGKYDFLHYVLELSTSGTRSGSVGISHARDDYYWRARIETTPPAG